MSLYKRFPKRKLINTTRLVPSGLGGIYDLTDTMPLLDYMFDQGSMASFVVTDQAAPTIRIVPIRHWSNTWAWWCVRSQKLAGMKPRFLIAKANHYNMVAGEWLACWSTAPDTDTWTQFDNVTIGATDLEFYHNTAFPNATIYISALPMYPFSRVQRRIQELSNSSLVSETISTVNKIIGYLTPWDSNDGTHRSCPGLPFYGLKIANAEPNVKNKTVLSSMGHPSETPGAYALEGALDWLLAGSPEAHFVLDWFEFFVYPCRSPQAVWAGYFRVNPDNLVSGPDWRTAGTGQWEVVEVGEPGIVADIGGVSADVMLDYHSEMTASDIGGVVVNGDVGGQYPIYAAAMEALDADFELTEAALGAEDYTLGKLLRDSYGVDLYSTLEQGGEVARGIAAWKAYGTNTLKAIKTMVAQGNFPNGPSVGSRDMNGTTDRIDWANVFDTAGSPLTISAWVLFDAIAHSSYVLCTHRAGDAAFGTIFLAAVGGYIAFNRAGATALQIGTLNGTMATGAWAHVLVTHDGVMATFASVHIYINGSEGAYQGQVNGAGEFATTGSWSVGGRIYDDGRNIDGHIAQLGVWDRVLNATEIANLAAGYAPSLISTDLQFYWPSNINDLTATPPAGGSLGVADGTAFVSGVGNGPGIIYP